MAIEGFKTFLLFISLSLATQTALNYYYRKKKKDKNGAREVHEVMMFSHGMPALKKSKYSRCIITHSMDRVLHHISSTRETIDICMYVLTNMDLTNVLLKLHYRGVKIRFIIDADMAYASGSHIRRLEKQGIPVRWMKSENLMHHKFCIIDAWSTKDIPKVMMGSLNWTTQALNGNWEDVTVTSQQQLVEQYRAEFERLWELFKPVVKF